jgi:hypothetical protein
MSSSNVGTADKAVPTPNTLDEEAVGRALEFCDRALDLLSEKQRLETVDSGVQEIAAAVQGIRTELMLIRS